MATNGRKSLVYAHVTGQPLHVGKRKEEELTRYEEEHRIDERWLPGSNIYKETQKLLAEQSY